MICVIKTLTKVCLYWKRSQIEVSSFPCIIPACRWDDDRRKPQFVTALSIKSADGIDEFLDGLELFNFELPTRRGHPAFFLKSAHDANGGFDRRAGLLRQFALSIGKYGSIPFMKA